MLPEAKNKSKDAFSSIDELSFLSSNEDKKLAQEIENAQLTSVLRNLSESAFSSIKHKNI